MQQFYAARDHRPLWQDPDSRQQLAGALANLANDGLPVQDYPLASDGVAAACAERRNTHSWALAVWHLLRGRLERGGEESLWRAPGLPSPDSGEERLLSLLTAHADHPGAALEAARPALPAYAAIRKALSRLPAPPPEVSGRRAEDGDTETLPAGPVLHPGERAPRVAAMRRILTRGGWLPSDHRPADESLYDAALADALRTFQYHHGLAEDGILGPRTLAALNLSPRQRRARLAANLERWRWRAADPLDQGIVVDIAGAFIEYREGGQARWWARTQVGTPQRPTPSLRSAVNRLTLNPAWIVPPTILRQDKLPALRRDPAFLDAQDMEVLDFSGRILDPATIDWQQPGGIMLRQRPGPGNPLGQVAIRFPNPFSVYLHDTPSQRLFSRAHRSQSSGCVRVEEAMTLAAQLFQRGGAGSESQLQTALDSGLTREIPLPQPVPILLDYWTADVDDVGRVILRPDLYGRDAALAAALQTTAGIEPLPGCPTTPD